LRARGPTDAEPVALGGGAQQAIDIHEGEAIDAAALKALIREAVAANLAKPARGRK
jgi:hypothetical protein